MKILSIETSCDETAIALLDISGELARPDIKVLGNTLLSQVALHEQYGGVFPALAMREHQKNLPILLEQTFKEAGYDLEQPDIDFIAVTSGPGLEPALWTGITFAEDLGKKWSASGRKVPVVPVNHMEGHMYSVLYRTESNSKSQAPNHKLDLPALALLVSGGHTELVHIKDFGDYEIIGRTLDDAVGEAFDKVARMLGLKYPGGPKISELADKSRAKKPEIDFKLPRPMIHSQDLNFSFSGLKTAVLYKIRDTRRDDPRYAEGSGKASEEFKQDLARAFEDAAVEVLVKKTRKALEELDSDIKTLIVAGGVSANRRLSHEIKKLTSQFSHLTLRLPDKALTTDNAIMIGIAGFISISTNPGLLRNQAAIKASGNLTLSS